MSQSLNASVRASIQTLTPYATGKSIEEIKRLYDLDEVIKLASNENPLGPSPKAIQAAQNALSTLGRYPDPSGQNLKQALANHLQVNSEQITLGNGSDSLISLIATVFTEKDSEVIISQYGFAAFFIAAHMNQATPIVIPEQNFQADLTAMVAAITEKTRLIYLANPNNPTGTWHNERDITTFLEHVPESVSVVIDEAYFEYMDAPDYPNSIQLQQRFANVVTTRTFSKAYGLAGLRIGYTVSSPEICDYLNRIRSPFNVTTPSQAAAIAAIEDQSHLDASLALNKAGKAQWLAALDEFGLSHIPSACNFITVDIKQNGVAFCQKLLEKGIILRPLDNYHLPNHIRISIGTETENAKAIEQMQYLLGD